MPLNTEATETCYQTVLNIIYRALGDLNTQLPKDRRIEHHPDTKLFGPEGALDSTELCNFIIVAEEKLKDGFGKNIDLTQDDPFSSGTGHFKTVDSLARHVTTVVQEQGE